MSSVVSEELAHGTARVRSEVLQRRCIGRRRTHNYCVLHGVSIRQSFDDLCDRRTLLTNSNVDAVQLCLLILAVIEPLLVDNGINCDGRFAADTIISPTSVTTDIFSEWLDHTHGSLLNARHKCPDHTQLANE